MTERASKRSTWKAQEPPQTCRGGTIRIFVEGREITEAELPMAIAEAGREPRYSFTDAGWAAAYRQKGAA